MYDQDGVSHGTKFLDPDHYLDRDLDNFVPCKLGIRSYTILFIILGKTSKS